MSEIRQTQESILLLDLGACNTKAVLLDLVEEQYGLVATAVAPSTARDPWQDLSFGAIQAISRLEGICGRTLLGTAGPDEGQLITPEDEDGCGVDRLLVVSSAGEPLRVLLAGGVHEVSLASARRALQSTYARLQGILASDHGSASQKLDAVLRSDADVVLFVGGTEGGASAPTVEMARDILRVAFYLLKDDAPRVLYAGNQAVAGEVTELLKNVAAIEVTDNVRPTVEIEDIAPAAQALNSFYHEQKMLTLPGLRTIRQWSRAMILPTVRATETAIRCCAQVFETDKPALGVDLGSASLALHIARDQHVRTAVRTDLGMGQSLLGLLDQVEPDEIVRWLPFEPEEGEFLDWFYHKAFHPQTVPHTRRDLWLELAVARELIRLALADLLPAWEAEVGRLSLGQQPMAPPCDPIVGSGSLLAHVPHPGLAALVLLDALQPLGVSALYQDENDLLPAVGSVAKIEPLATVQVLKGEGLLFLGTVVAPRGHARSGDKVLTVRSLDPDVEIDQEVRYGELCVLPATLLGDAPEPPMLELVPTRGFDLGRGAGKSIQVPFRPGAVGWMIDARGRPLHVAQEGERRRAQIDEWLFTMTGERGE